MNKDIEKVLKRIITSGYKAYVVGGYVRDKLLGKNSKDIDIATNALPLELIKIFPNAKIDEQYGSIKIFTKYNRFDITTFREDIYINDKLEIHYTENIEKDALRRDFTINAIYMDIQGNIIDPLNGIKDLKSKTIRIIEDADTRFIEDPLRILRTIRFKIQLDFQIEESTLMSIHKNKQLLNKISYYKKKEELNKIFTLPNKIEGLKLIKEYKLDSLLNITYENVNFTNDPLGIWTQIDFSDEYPFTKQEKEVIKKLKSFNEISNEKIYKNGLYISLIAAEILNTPKENLIKQYKKLPIYEKNDIKINYKKLKNLGYKDNEINGIINLIEKAILNGKLKNNLFYIKKYLKKRK